MQCSMPPGPALSGCKGDNKATRSWQFLKKGYNLRPLLSLLRYFPLPPYERFASLIFLGPTTVAHNCHGKTKNLSKKQNTTTKSKTSWQKQNTSRQNQKPHRKNKIPHGKTETSPQKQKPHGKNKIPHDKNKTFTAKRKLFCFCCEVLICFCHEVFVFPVRFLVLP